jgi:hypothetical protein
MYLKDFLHTMYLKDYLHTMYLRLLTYNEFQRLSFNYPKNLKGILLLSKESQRCPLTIQRISIISSYYPKNL